MNRKKMLIATLAIALAVSLSVVAYAALYKSVTTSPVKVVGLSDQLKMFVTQPYYWDGGAGSKATKLAAGNTYTLYLGVGNQLAEPSGDTYMVYIWEANERFELSYLAAYNEANIHDNTGDIPDYWGNEIKWYQFGNTVVGYCTEDPFKLPADHWFVTEMWFTLSDNTPTLTDVTLTVYEYNSFTPAADGTVLSNVDGLDHTGNYAFDPTGLGLWK